MALTKSFKSTYKFIKLKLQNILIVLSFLAATITVCSFIYQAFRWFQGDWRNSDFYHWMTQSKEALIMMGLYFTVACLILRRCYQLNKRQWRRLKLGRLFILGIGLQILLSLPFGLLQAVQEQYWIYFHMKTCPSWLRILTPLTHWPINVAGYTVHWVFESAMGPNSRLADTGNVGPWTQLLFFTLLVFCQISIISLIWGLRYQKRHTVLDWGIAVVLVLFIGNTVTWFFMS